MVNTSNSKKISARDVFYFRQRQKNIVFSKLAAFFEEEAKRRGVTRKDLAEILDKEPSQISRWLSSPSNITLDTISDILLALDAVMAFDIQQFENAPRANFTHPLAIAADKALAVTLDTRPSVRISRGVVTAQIPQPEAAKTESTKFSFEFSGATP